MSPTSRKRAVSRGEFGRHTVAGQSFSALPKETSSGSRSSCGSVDMSMGSPVTKGSNEPYSSLQKCYPDRKSIRWLHTCFQLGPSLQLIVLFGILIFLVYTHVRSNHLMDRVTRFRQEESALMLQLQKIERHATTLHKDIQRRLRKAGMGDSASEPVSLEALSGRLYAHVLDLQRAIQKDARSKIIERYGEGPLKLVLNLQFADEEERGRGAANSQLEILFWTATPHATWTLLEQVGRHIWDGAVFEWGSQDKVLQVTPVHDDPQQRGRLEFTEFLKDQQHNAWTVGLRDDPDTGKLQLFLNLQDNAESHDHETCVGRVISGFDVLQRLILGIRQQAADAAPAAIIRQAIAMHVTTK